MSGVVMIEVNDEDVRASVDKKNTARKQQSRMEGMDRILMARGTGEAEGGGGRSWQIYFDVMQCTAGPRLHGGVYAVHGDQRKA